MKKFKYLFLVLLGITLLLGKNVNATTKGNLSMTYQDGIFYVMTSNNFYMSYPFPFYTINNSVVYCIEPGANINTWSYVGEDGFVNSPFPAEINSKLELIGHYGYGYPNHDTTKYRLATQALMWEITGKKNVEFYTKQYGNGDKINVDYEKNEIMTLVNKHYIKPSFDNSDFIALYNKTLVIKDLNNVLENYEVIDDGNNEVKKVKDTLYITPLTLNNSTIKLRRLEYDNETTVVFIGEGINSQKLAKFRSKDQTTVTFNLNTIGSKLKIIKVDEETNETITGKKIKFKIKSLDNDEYVCDNLNNCLFETDDNGVVITPFVLIGNFQIEEIEEQDLTGYLWNSQILNVTIDENTNSIENIYEIRFPNTRVKGKVNINKIGEKLIYDDKTYHYEEIPLEKVEYGLYANEDIYIQDKIKYKKDEQISILITDELGNASLDNLELGKYYVKELSSNLDNMIDNTKYSFELKYKDKYTKTVNINLSFKDYLPKGKLEFLKIDLFNNNPIPDTLIEIYNINNKLVYSGYTDNLGMIIIDNLPLDSYYIKEKESAKGYQNTEEILNFEIKENNEKIKVSLANELIVKVPDTMLNKIDLPFLIGIILIIVGNGWYIYAKKKEK